VDPGGWRLITLKEPTTDASARNQQTTCTDLLHTCTRTRPHHQAAGGRPFTRADLEAAGGSYSADPTYGTQLVYLPRAAEGLPALLAATDVLIDETYYGVAPANISQALGFATVAEAGAGVPAVEAGRIFRCARVCVGGGEGGGGGGGGWPVLGYVCIMFSRVQIPLLKG